MPSFKQIDLLMSKVCNCLCVKNLFKLRHGLADTQLTSRIPNKELKTYEHVYGSYN
jgi:hypothetical protein